MGRTLTELEHRTLEALRTAAAPLGAYDVLAALRQVRPTVAAPTAYRTLDRLIAAGLVHRLESVNAYVACCVEHGEAPPVFSICDGCGTVGEFAAPAVASEAEAVVAEGGFLAERSVLELRGRCAACRA